MKTLIILLASVLIFLLIGCATTPQPQQKPQQRPSGGLEVSVDMEVPFELLKPERQKEAQELGYKPGEKVRIFKPKDGDIRILPKK